MYTCILRRCLFLGSKRLFKKAVKAFKEFVVPVLFYFTFLGEDDIGDIVTLTGFMFNKYDSIARLLSDVIILYNADEKLHKFTEIVNNRNSVIKLNSEQLEIFKEYIKTANIWEFEPNLDDIVAVAHY